MSTGKFATSLPWLNLPCQENALHDGGLRLRPPKPRRRSNLKTSWDWKTASLCAREQALSGGERNRKGIFSKLQKWRQTNGI